MDSIVTRYNFLGKVYPFSFILHAFFILLYTTWFLDLLTISLFNYIPSCTFINWSKFWSHPVFMFYVVFISSVKIHFYYSSVSKLLFIDKLGFETCHYPLYWFIQTIVLVLVIYNLIFQIVYLPFFSTGTHRI